MTSKFWASSEDASVDASEGAETIPRDPSVEEVSTDSIWETQDLNRGTVIRTMASQPRMPNLQPHQHASLFYLSLIEGRCKTQAARQLNEGVLSQDQLPEDHPEVMSLAKHLFIEMKKELVKAKMVPEEFAGEDLPDLRQYLNSFDAVLNNIAPRRASEISVEEVSGTIDLYDPFPSSLDHSLSLFAPGTALVPQGFFTMTDQNNKLQQAKAEVYRLLGAKTGVDSIEQSLYKKEYKQICRLGKGGFGSVYKAQYLLDDRIYAIKKIVIRPKHFSKIKGPAQLKALLKEANALARFHHHNIVRYNHSWIEFRRAEDLLEEKEKDDRSEGGEDSDSSEEGDEDDDEYVEGIMYEDEESSESKDYSSQIRSVSEKKSNNKLVASPGRFNVSIKLSNSKALDDHFNRQRRRSSVSAEHLSAEFMGMIKFGDDSPQDDSTSEDSNKKFDKPIKTLDNQLDEEESIEIADSHPEIGMVLYIKMTTYPMSLDDFLWPEKQKQDAPKVEHCYHTSQSIQILTSILDGVMYLHRQKLIHRDLKPGNIFLQILEPDEPPPPHYIDLSACRDCPAHEPHNTVHICPVIGDFGLIHDIQAKFSEAESDNVVGTHFYCPTEVPVVCEKLDVYALGVIAFELTQNFGTLSERGIVLSGLRNAVFPAGFDQNPLASGIREMLRREREERWGCEEVGRWLGEMREKFA